MKIKKRNIFRIIWFSFVSIFFIWQCSNYQSRDLPENTFDNNSTVTVEKSDDKITFVSKNTIKKSEIIFFQGGLTDPKAYAPLCRQIAENGFTCHLIKMDWRMPQLDYSKINEMFDLKNGNYIIGGHSQGAKIASQFVYENPSLMDGLFLLGTSHPRDFDLSDRNLPTIKLYAEYDGLASVPEVMENKGKLPKNTDLIEVVGGNHSQFGYLGKLLTDESPEISLAEQQRFTLKTLTDFFIKIEKRN
jgi:hypothetical protein